ncbi:hypothetical protein I302_104244 [Kwoniella bestiolae CBS 10118]|uniref:WSC domain-containing protein n=1 Tax=Kwoniella bestiolae CBS 10118 TaxID=1296100 RepID=A0A1B9GAQ2_9TREE|nr:hypothetical protein I302_02953 [Kwoniella bestiolae CBS 10118]OCF28102.1 hypothetical protein I302_02953 [Kwoniella bestiolae CBS 10118]
MIFPTISFFTLFIISSLSIRLFASWQDPYDAIESNDTITQSNVSPQDSILDDNIPNPTHIQFIGCISFSGYQQLLQENGVQGVYLPTREGCISLCRVDQSFGLAYFSQHAMSCYCAPKEQSPMIEWVVGGADDEGNCGGWDDVTASTPFCPPRNGIDYLNLPWIFHGCYSSLWSTPYYVEPVRDPIHCVEDSCQSSDGSVALFPRREADGWLCACFREPTEGVIGRPCGLGIWQGYYRKLKYDVEPSVDDGEGEVSLG